jgi:hypothetical protein
VSGSRLLYSVFIGLFRPTKLKTIYSALHFRGINLSHRLSICLKCPIFPRQGHLLRSVVNVRRG